jgi:hypothetical protein
LVKKNHHKSPGRARTIPRDRPLATPGIAPGHPWNAPAGVPRLGFRGPGRRVRVQGPQYGRSPGIGRGGLRERWGKAPKTQNLSLTHPPRMPNSPLGRGGFVTRRAATGKERKAKLKSTVCSSSCPEAPSRVSPPPSAILSGPTHLSQSLAGFCQRLIRRQDRKSWHPSAGWCGAPRQSMAVCGQCR